MSRRRIVYWTLQGLVPHVRYRTLPYVRYEFQGLIVAFVLAKLRRRLYSLQMLRPAAGQLTSYMADATWPLRSEFRVLVGIRDVAVVLIHGDVVGHVAGYERIDVADLLARVESANGSTATSLPVPRT